ncbi:DUF2303 family protein [Roseospira goensis]|uniref:Uncharacterized protein YfdQ (DUF2303 family) n=1 Tax=Roseospira goensis TaxID=391922 RepID=A0A7W6S422_9PROT|nr:DUF2303 family protein [Roseospira goensis]MBB4287950.1 uncharacterized protein YfdQ (DUF2303 family) [Roseospira goensis]
MSPETQTETGALTRFMIDHVGVDVLCEDATERPIAVVPEGKRLESLKPLLDQYRDRPQRISGRSEHLTLDSLIDHIKAHDTMQTAVFISRDPAQAVAVYDYVSGTLPEAEPNWRNWRAVHDFPLSREWQLWSRASGDKKSQGAFAAFVEDRILDILPAPDLTGEPATESDRTLRELARLLTGTFAGPERMMELARGLVVHETSRVGEIINTSSGEGSIIFEKEHTDGAGQKLTIPSLFCIAIPVFDQGVRYRMVARLRYRKTREGLVWWFDLQQVKEVFDDAFRDAAGRIGAETGVPVYAGTPEAPVTA